MSFRALSIVFLLAFCVSSIGLAQSGESEEPPSQKKGFFDHFEWISKQRPDLHEVNFVAGYSFGSTHGFWGKIPEATLSIFTLRYNRKLLNVRKKHLIEYVAEANLSANYTLSNTRRYEAADYTGFGITPIGFQFNLFQKNVVQPFFKSSAGFMYFKEPFPNERGVKFNFTLELGAGLEFVVAPNLSLTLGYKYHHMSNGEFGDINPGIDSNIFYSGITIF